MQVFVRTNQRLDTAGINHADCCIRALPAGRHTFNVSAPQLDKGTYVVHVYAGSHDYETIIFKNR